MTSFLPKDYKSPKSSNGYMKIQEGENKVRILSSPVLGWEDWDDKKPVRFRFDQKPAKSLVQNKPVRHFWSMIVWNYSEEKIQILHVTQATIRNKIESLCSDQDWGQPFFYDIKIIKKGEGVDTEYDINPLPHKELHPSIEEAFNENPCNLDALFDNGDPFDVSNKRFTLGVFKKEVVQEKPKNEKKVISSVDVQKIEVLLAQCSEVYKDTFWEKLMKLNISRLEDISTVLFVKIESDINKHLSETKVTEEVPF